MIDLHAHLLPAVDDGPRDVRTAVTMARMSAADGVRSVVCTPHRRAGHHVVPDQVLAAIAALQPELDAAGVDVRLVPGLEIAIDHAGRMDDAELRAASLGGTGRWLLIEMPFQGWPIELPDLMSALEMRGFSTVLAHPERCSSVQASPDRMRDLVGRGALVQVTAESLTGELGAGPQRAALALARAGFVHVVASDMHTPTRRGPGLSEGLAAAAHALGVAPQEIEWMVDAVPQAIIDGGDVRPPRIGGPPPRER